MDKPLSFSAYKRFTTCPKYYEYYDIKKDKPGGETSALLVGTIVDEVVMAKLIGKEIDYKELISDVYGKVISFYLDDLDLDLINTDDITDYAKTLGWKGRDINKALKDFIKNQDTLSDSQYKVLHRATWQSLSYKIGAMVDSFNKWILPQIDKVHDIQTHLDNGIVHGYLDFTATMKDGKKVLFDLKTSKMPYTKDAVLKSPQLSLYASLHGYEYAGFIVLCKTLNKNKQKSCKTCDFETSGGNRTKCPTCKETLDVVMNPSSYSQLIVNKVPQHNKDLTNGAMSDTIKCIDNGVFPRNLNACDWMYGKPCPYRKKCWEA